MLYSGLQKLRHEVVLYKECMELFIKNSSRQELVLKQMESRLNFNINTIKELKGKIQELEKKKKKTLLENQIEKLKYEIKEKETLLNNEMAISVLNERLDYVDDFIYSFQKKSEFDNENFIFKFEILLLEENSKSKNNLIKIINSRIHEKYNRFFYIIKVKLSDEGNNEHWFFVVQECGVNITVYDSVGLNKASQNIFEKFIKDTDNKKLIYYRNDLTLMHNSNCCEMFTLDILFSLLRNEIFNGIVYDLDRFYKLSQNIKSKNLNSIYKSETMEVPENQYSYCLPEFMAQLFDESYFRKLESNELIKRNKYLFDSVNNFFCSKSLFSFNKKFSEVYEELLKTFAMSLINIQANSQQMESALINIYYFLDNSESYLDKNLTSIGLKPTEKEFNNIKSLINKYKEFNLNFQENFNNYYSISLQAEQQGIDFNSNKLEESNKLVFEHIFKKQYNIGYEQFCILNNIIENIKNSSIYIQLLNKYDATDFSNPNGHAKLGIVYHNTILFRSRIFNNNDIISNHELTNNEIIFQNMLGRFARLQGLPIEENHYFNSDQQAMLVPDFIDSITLTRLNDDNNIVFGYNENIREITPDFDTILENDGHINFIYTLGTMNNLNPDVGVHYVAGQIFMRSGVMTVLHYDSLNRQINDEFREFLGRQFGNNVNIVNVNNEIFRQAMGTNTCGIFALSAVHDGGILDRARQYYIANNNFHGVEININNLRANIAVVNAVQNENISIITSSIDSNTSKDSLIDSKDNLENNDDNLAVINDIVYYGIENGYVSDKETIGGIVINQLDNSGDISVNTNTPLASANI